LDIEKWTCPDGEQSAQKKMIRDIETTDYPAILELNLESVRFLSPLGLDQLAHLHREAAYSKVLEDDGRFAGFILALRNGADYDSPNYVWFTQRYNMFLYIDRIVVDRDYRRKGYGENLYSDLTAFAAKEGVGVLACEIDIFPPNPVSRRFHQKHGFCEVGNQWLYDGKKQVSYLEKRLIPGQ
jgi:predicted GNAT superfamily acetyltransferase